MVSAAHAATPTASQIQQLKQLPRAQQEQLARKYGVDLERLTANTANQNLQTPPSTTPLPERIGGSQALLESAPQEKLPSNTLEPFGYAFFD